jgi:hypothetical protein
MNMVRVTYLRIACLAPFLLNSLLAQVPGAAPDPQPLYINQIKIGDPWRADAFEMYFRTAGGTPFRCVSGPSIQSCQGSAVYCSQPAHIIMFAKDLKVDRIDVTLDNKDDFKQVVPYLMNAFGQPDQDIPKLPSDHSPWETRTLIWNRGGAMLRASIHVGAAEISLRSVAVEPPIQTKTDGSPLP